MLQFDNDISLSDMQKGIKKISTKQHIKHARQVFRVDLPFERSFRVPNSVCILNAAAQHVTRLDALFATTVAAVNSAATQRGQR